MRNYVESENADLLVFTEAYAEKAFEKEGEWDFLEARYPVSSPPGLLLAGWADEVLAVPLLEGRREYGGFLQDQASQRRLRLPQRDHV